MGHLVDTEKNNRCTVIESPLGMVKLIRRVHNVNPTLITSNFSSLEDCLKYAEKNRFEISIIHSGKRRNHEESRHPKAG